MSIFLSVISFICLTLLLVLVPPQCVRPRIPTAFLLFWLLLMNLSNGVTTSLPLGQPSSAIMHWCDIASHLSFTSPFAITTACICIIAHLSHSASVSKSFILLNCVLYLGAPFIYLVSYDSLRDQRFLLVETYGCVPSTSSSPSSLAVVGGFPLFLCICTFVLTVFSVSARRKPIQLSLIRPATPGRRAQIWRAVLLSTLSVTLVAILSAISMAAIASAPHIGPAVGAGILSLTDMPILQSMNVVLSWWLVPTVSVIACLVLMSDRETWAWYRGLTNRVFSNERSVTSLPMVSTNISAAPAYHLRSSWDDTLREARPAPWKSVVSLHVDTSDSTLRMTPHANSEEETALDSFAESTLTYVGSPTGRRALGELSPRSFSPPKLAAPPALLVAPPTPTFDPTFVVAPTLGGRKTSDSELSAFSTLSDSRSLLASSAWPVPPAALPAAPFARDQPRADLPREAVPRGSVRYHTRRPSGFGVRLTVEQRIL